MLKMAGSGVVLCFGEILLRLSASRGESLLEEARLLAHFGGAEANVAVALAGLGRAARMLSLVPDNAVGRSAMGSLRRRGVDVSSIRVCPGRLGLYFLEPGAGARAASVVYDRAGSLFARARPGDFDWDDALAGADWLHLSGITPALGVDASNSALAAIAEARARGVRVSFDGNYRAQLWAARGGDAQAVLRGLVDGADLFIGNHRDIGLLLGGNYAGDDEPDRRVAALDAFAAFPRLRWIASTSRHVEDADRQSLAARLDTPETYWEVPEVRLTAIIDRIGTGDAFAAGILDGLLDDDASAALRTGHAMAVLKHFALGDHSQATRADIDAFLAGERDVRR